jgi:hypothetical protein
MRAGLWSIVSQLFLPPTATTGTGSSSSSRTCNSATGPANDNEAAAIKWDEDAERATAEIFLDLDKRVECGVRDI